MSENIGQSSIILKPRVARGLCTKIELIPYTGESDFSIALHKIVSDVESNISISGWKFHINGSNVYVCAPLTADLNIDYRLFIKSGSTKYYVEFITVAQEPETAPPDDVDKVNITSKTNTRLIGSIPTLNTDVGFVEVFYSTDLSTIPSSWTKLNRTLNSNATFQLTNLIADTEYYLYLLAYNENGSSMGVFSKDKTNVNPVTPKAQFFNVLINTANVNWPTFSADAIEHRLYLKNLDEEDSEYELHTTETVNNYNPIVNNLIAGSKYVGKFSIVYPQNIEVFGEESEFFYTLVETPEEIKPINITPNSITISSQEWNESWLRLDLKMKLHSSDDWSIVEIYNENQTNDANILNLTANTDYDFQWVAHYRYGNVSSLSRTIKTVTIFTPDVILQYPDCLRFNNITHESIKIVLPLITFNTIGFKLYATTDTDAEWNLIYSTTNSGSIYTYSNLEENTFYYFKLVSYNGNISLESDIQYVRTLIEDLETPNNLLGSIPAPVIEIINSFKIKAPNCSNWPLNINSLKLEYKEKEENEITPETNFWTTLKNNVQINEEVIFELENCMDYDFRWVG